MLIQTLQWCGRHGRWVLPMGLVAGMLLPAFSKPMQAAIPLCIAALLFLAVVRLYPVVNSTSVESELGLLVGHAVSWVAIAQFVTPFIVLGLGVWLQFPTLWVVAATLVAAAPPISGSPNLVLLLKGDGDFALRCLVVGTALLPLTCIPILLLLLTQLSLAAIVWSSLLLLGLIVTSVSLAVVYCRFSTGRDATIHADAVDGASAIVLAVMVVGLMSAIHEPDVQWTDMLKMLVLAFVINGGLQLLSTLVSIALKTKRSRTIATGVMFGNRNIALFLSALPASQMEPLLLFIACYQVPMYLTPLIGHYAYRHLE